MKKGYTLVAIVATIVIVGGSYILVVKGRRTERAKSSEDGTPDSQQYRVFEPHTRIG
jgi:hypothetical protein